MSNVRDLVEKVTSLPGYTAQLSGAEKSKASCAVDASQSGHGFITCTAIRMEGCKGRERPVSQLRALRAHRLR
jgi:hypothetical protein